MTKKVAQEWSELKAAPGDRALNENRVSFYIHQVNELEMRTVDWAKAFCKQNGEWYRVNGKHTSTAFSRINNSDLSGIFAMVEEFECENLEDVAALYATFDSRIQSRTTTDVNKSYAASVPELDSLHIRSVNLAVSGLSWYTSPKKPHVGLPKDRAELMLSHIPAVLWLSETAPYTNKKYRFVFRVPVAGAMLATYFVSREAATEFWNLVKCETGVRPECPDRVLAKFLSGIKVDGSPNSRALSLSERAGPLEVYSKCIYAWNAWRRGDDLDRLRYIPGNEPPVPN
jgi:hypothetical protein